MIPQEEKLYQIIQHHTLIDQNNIEQYQNIKYQRFMAEDNQSDSDSNPEIAALPQEKHPHSLQIIAKAKQIAPFYDQSTLWGLYKQYFSNQTVFINHLQMKAQERKQQKQAKNNEEWISIGRKMNKENPKKVKSNNSYNFLLDRQLIARALGGNKPVAKFVEKEQTKKPLYKEKQVQVKKTVSKQQKQAKDIQTNHKQQNNKKKYQEKQTESKQISKKQPIKVESTAKVQAKQSKIEPKVQTKVEPVTKNQVKEEKQVKPQGNTKIKYQQKKTEKQEVKTQQFKAKKEVQSIKKQYKQKQEAPQAQKVHVSAEERNKRFQKQCEKNEFILKFLRPTERVQKVKYHLINGQAQQISTRLVLPENK